MEVSMRSFKLRTWLTIGAVPALALATAIQSTAAASVQQSSLASARVSGPPEKVILILRDQNSGLAPRSARLAAAVGAEQAPLIAELHSVGARDITSTSVLNTVIATVPTGDARILASNPAVASVVPDGIIQGPSTAVPASLVVPAGLKTSKPLGTGSPSCGTAGSPELDPEALTNINATPAELGTGNDGAGVTVAYLADGVETTNPDYQRNAAFASAGSPAGSPVITQEDFSQDGTSAPTAGGEAFLDSSSIAAQGNSAYDLSSYVSTAHTLPAGCDIKIIGAAPGASVLGLKIFGQNNDTTTSGFIQAISYAVTHGAKVINESFGSNQFPDTTADAIREADDAAVAAGVTVVVSSGDAGATSTIGSPATDPHVISVGATTTFRAYEQVSYGGINDPSASGTYVDNNISNLSSGGYSQGGRTVDLVAPGDLNWALCDADTALFSDCTNENGAASDIELSGGTSESSPLTAAAAADVIQAYASSHGGTDPSPALVKQILVSTATDIGAPADEQGAGLLNVLAAVTAARSIKVANPTTGGVLVSPTQINVAQKPGTSTTDTITLTNAGPATTVHLSTRALNTHKVGNTPGSFCMQPGTPTTSCPANTGSFPIWSGVTEVYQNKTFTVPATTGTSRLEFAADYPYTGQSSLLHFALIEPDGAYAGYSLPQGLGDYGNVEVTNPPAGKWTVVFFTEKDGATAGGVGTSGTIQWDASTYEYAAAAKISPSSIAIGAGKTATAKVTIASPATAGDMDQSIVVRTTATTTTIPVTLRTLVPMGADGGTFAGVLTGGNGRAGAQAQSNTYAFDVPSGKKDIDVSVTLSTDPGDELIGLLVDPQGQTVGYSTNVTTDNFGTPLSTPWLDIYHVAPAAGQWRLVLDWLNPVTGSELTEPFHGAVRFNQVSVTNDLPASSTVHLKHGKTYKYTVTVNNTGVAPEAFFVDPRLDHNATVNLVDQNGSATNMKLPLPPGLSFPYYYVPTNTSQLEASITGNAPVTFDLEYFPGDPDVSPALNVPPVSSTVGHDKASLTLTEPAVSPGLWLLNPDEIGPYPASGAPSVKATATLKAVTRAFDLTVTSSTGDLWSAANGLTSPTSFSPMYVPAGDSVNITVEITPTAAAGTTVNGTLYVSDYVVGSFTGVALPDADELAGIPYSYKVSS
jgi:hypothetical protein